MLDKTIKSPKTTLDDLPFSKDVIMGNEVIHIIKEEEKRQ
jgi:hypothetical protein